MAAIMDDASLSGTHKFLTAKFQIGSRRGPVNYSGQETVFHPDDVPTAKKDNRAFVKKWKRGGAAPGEKALWNASSSTDQPRYRRTRINSDHDRPYMRGAVWYAYNLRAEHLPPKNLEPVPKPHKFKVDVMPEERKREIRAALAADPVLAGRGTHIEMEVNRKLRDKVAWNQSSCVEDGDRERRFRAQQKRAVTNSRRAAARLQTYTRPQNIPLPGLPEDRRVDPATWTADATGRLQPPAPVDDRSIATYNRNTTRPTVKSRKFEHSGVFEFNGQEGQWMWSDTGSFVRESPGDIVKVHNPNAYNFASPTMSL